MVEACFTEHIILFVPLELIDELTTSIRASVYLSTRIAPTALNHLIDALTDAGTLLPPLSASSTEQIAYTRDDKDDYLIAQALLYDVDCVVSGDKDLLDLVAVEQVRMLSPVQFWAYITNRQ